MSSILTTLILLLFWGVGYFIYDLGAVIHVLMAVALIIIGLRFMQGKKMKMKLRGKYY